MAGHTVITVPFVPSTVTVTVDLKNARPGPVALYLDDPGTGLLVEGSIDGNNFHPFKVTPGGLSVTIGDPGVHVIDLGGCRYIRFNDTVGDSAGFASVLFHTA